MKIKRMITVLLIAAVTAVCSVYAAAANELLKYQLKNSVCAFTADEFADIYNGSVIPESIVITSLPSDKTGSLEVDGRKVEKNRSIMLNDISSLTFTPSENYLGDVTFSYRFYNGSEYSENSNVTIKYVENLSNAVPTAVSFSIETETDTPKKAKLNYTYTGNESLSYTIFESPKKGSVEITGINGEFVYTPHSGATGNDSFSFRVSTSSIDSNIATCSISISSAVQPPSPFNFVYQDTQNHWVNYSAVKMVERDIYKGERIGSKYYFRPETQLTRIDVINYILAALDVNIDDVNTDDIHIFTDSPQLPDYINKAAYKAYQLGIIEGSKTDGGVYLNPYSPINRSETVKMLDKAIGPKTLSDGRLNYIDAPSVPDWAVQHFKNMIAYGIVRGYDDNSLRPFESVTKAQATEMIYQMLKYNDTNTPTLARRTMPEFYFKRIL